MRLALFVALAVGVWLAIRTLVQAFRANPAPDEAERVPSTIDTIDARGLPGGAPANPIIVDTPAVIERHAERWPCPACGGATRCEPHRAVELPEGRFRVARPRCKHCGFERDAFFVLRAQTLN